MTDFPVSWRADEATPEGGTPIIECCKTCSLELRPVLLGSPSTVVTRQSIRLPVTISILVVTTGSAGGISAETSGLELGPCFGTDAWRGFKLWQPQRAAGLCVIQF